MGGGADGADRLVVVHPHRAEQADRAERARRQSVGRADEGDVVQAGVIEPDADERPPDVERLASSARAPRRASRARREGAGRPRARPRGRRRGARRRRRRTATAPSAPPARRTRAAARRGTRAPAPVRPGSSNRLRSVCVPSPTPTSRSFRYSLAQAARPGSTGSVEREQLLGDAAGRGDRHDHHDGRLQQQHLDVAHRRRLEPRRRDEREQPRHLAQHLGGRLERVLDLAPHRRSGRAGSAPAAAPGARARPRRRSGSRRSVGTRPAEVCGWVSRPSCSSSASSLRTVDDETRQPGALDERLRADGLAGGDVLLDHAPEDLACARLMLGHLQENSSSSASSSAVTPPPRKRPRG